MLVDIDLADALQAMALLSLQRLAYQQEAELIAYPALPPLHQTLSELMDCGEIVLGWCPEGALLGAVGFVITDTYLDICRLVVHPAAQQRGIGRALVRAAVAAAQGKPCRVTTAAANLPALALYQQAGFVMDAQFATPDGLALVSLSHQG
ncbi:GNAT family N-acetyltransferase [Chitinimonas sp. BJYL2]|uniref:GNAT family N-acetyltransferase n=1 Tax=Chitinimonas sp. BJYL2 TaxID=2976696 RepID=UPI0022B5370E|nr:GNAT family N-acetyltransferase [Chitinimonas sp. BJYL2]